MARQRITQIFPWLLPLRRKQRLFCFYTKMRLDGRRYAEHQAETLLPYQIFETVCPMYNQETGFDMCYQENKVFNVKLAARKLDKLIIAPGETFSFCRSVRGADRDIPYKDALTEVDGKLITEYGGGLCQITNLLFWMFLHSPLTIVERHGHLVKGFPEPPSDAPLGVDATVAEGWLDLKVRNDTDTAYQISLTFDREHITGRVFVPRDTGVAYRVANGEICYYREGAAIFEETDILQTAFDTATGECVAEKVLYRNRCGIAYQLPPGIKIMEKGASAPL